MSLHRFQEIAEEERPIQAPLAESDLRLLGELCSVDANSRVLDLACGKGALLAQWTRRFGVSGVGVDANPDYILAAKQRAYECEAVNKLNFVVDDPAAYPQAHHQFDVIVNATMHGFGGTLAQKLHLMRDALRDNTSRILIGEAYWREVPSEAIADAMGVTPDAFTTLDALPERTREAGFELVEMFLTDAARWDRYEAAQWRHIRRFLEEHPHDKDAADLREWVQANRQAYLQYGRRYIGWGVFVLAVEDMPAGDAQPYENPDKVVGCEVANEMLWVRLHDGRVIANPVAWYPWLAGADADDAQDITITGDVIEWGALGQRLSVAELMRGRR